jgi:hypothetical protein
MIPRRVAFLLSLACLIFCLAAGYAWAGLWSEAVVAAFASFAWLLALKYPSSWLPHTCLFVSILIAAGGRLLGANPLFMICGSAVALAVWDLLLLEVAMGKESGGEPARRYWNMHLHSLMLALACGLIMAFLGRLISVQTPFIVVICTVALAAYGLNRIWSYFKTQSIRFP